MSRLPICPCCGHLRGEGNPGNWFWFMYLYMSGLVCSMCGAWTGPTAKRLERIGG